MERETNSDRIEHLANDIEEETVRMLGSLGLVDASLYEYDTPVHDDMHWQTDYDNPNIIRGEE